MLRLRKRCRILPEGAEESRMIHRVKEMNRALLELDLGILFGGVA